MTERERQRQRERVLVIFEEHRETPGATFDDAHFLDFLLAARRCRRSRDFATLAHGTPVRLAGLVTMRQRPETASGVTFVSLEDEDGIVNVVVWRDLAERQRRVLLESRLLAVEGRLESADGVQHLIAARLHDFTPLLGALDVRSRDFR